MDLSSSSSSSSSVSSTAYSNFGGTDDEKVGGITNGTGVMRGSTPVGTTPIGSAATTMPLTTTSTATAEPSVATSDFASLISSSGANTTSSTAYNNSNSSNSTCCISSINHVPESAARWIVAQLVEQAKSISTQSHTFQLETLFVHHANICPPTATTKQESARLFIESIIHRFSRQDRHRDGLACLKLTSLRYVATKLYEYCRTAKSIIRDKRNGNAASAPVTTDVAAAPNEDDIKKIQMYEDVISKLSSYKYLHKQETMHNLTSCFKIYEGRCNPFATNTGAMRPNDVLIQLLLWHQHKKPKSTAAMAAISAASTAAATASSNGSIASTAAATRIIRQDELMTNTGMKIKGASPRSSSQRKSPIGHHAATSANIAYKTTDSSTTNSVSMSHRKIAPIHHTGANAASQQDLDSDTDKQNKSYDSTPQSPHEQFIMSTLRSEMNFEDSQEILFSYRKLVRKQQKASAVSKTLVTSKPTADEVMFEIISQREEAEEAKKMDQARVLSELSRKDEAKRRRDIIQQEFQKSIELCTDIAALVDPNDKRLFSSSWILHDPTLHSKCQHYIIKNAPSTKNYHNSHDAIATAEVSPLKMQFLELLQLEKNSGKWYGHILPKSYFQHYVIERLKTSMVTKVVTTPQKSNRTSTSSRPKDNYDDNDSAAEMKIIRENLLNQIRFEITTLQSNIYDLAKQVGGVPKIFRDAHDRYALSVTGGSKSSSPTTRSKALRLPPNNDEDSVELVLKTPSSPSKKIRNPYITNSKPTNSMLSTDDESVNIPSKKRIGHGNETLSNTKKYKLVSSTTSPSTITAKTDSSKTTSSTIPIFVIDLC